MTNFDNVWSSWVKIGRSSAQVVEHRVWACGPSCLAFLLCFSSSFAFCSGAMVARGFTLMAQARGWRPNSPALEPSALRTQERPRLCWLALAQVGKLRSPHGRISALGATLGPLVGNLGVAGGEVSVTRAGQLIGSAISDLSNVVGITSFGLGPRHTRVRSRARARSHWNRARPARMRQIRVKSRLPQDLLSNAGGRFPGRMTSNFSEFVPVQRCSVPSSCSSDCMRRGLFLAGAFGRFPRSSVFFSMCACHLCAAGVRVFLVSFQVCRMTSGCSELLGPTVPSVQNVAEKHVFSRLCATSFSGAGNSNFRWWQLHSIGQKLGRIRPICSISGLNLCQRRAMQR